MNMLVQMAVRVCPRKCNIICSNNESTPKWTPCDSLNSGSKLIAQINHQHDTTIETQNCTRHNTILKTLSTWWSALAIANTNHKHQHGPNAKHETRDARKFGSKLGNDNHNQHNITVAIKTCTCYNKMLTLPQIKINIDDHKCKIANVNKNKTQKWKSMIHQIRARNSLPKSTTNMNRNSNLQTL